jgi:hypothetical protein
MAVSLTWNSTVLPMPVVDGVRVERSEMLGRHARMVDGSLRSDIVAEKHVINIAWVDLTSAEYTTLANAYSSNRSVARTLVLPDSRSFSVLPRLGSWAETLFFDAGGNALYSVQLSFLEV